MVEKKKTRKEKFIEFFKIRKNGKIKTIKKSATIEIPETSKNQIRNENRILINLFGAIFVFLIVLFAFWFVGKMSMNFSYEGVDFNVVRQGNIIFYNTKLPALYQGQHIKYNIFLRNDPRSLEKNVPFEGNWSYRDFLVLDSTSPFSCEGRGAIAVANLVQLYQIMGAQILRSPNATCDSEDRYTLIKLVDDNSTYVQEVAPSCYEVHINQCEVLEGTERIMIEMLVKIQDLV